MSLTDLVRRRWRHASSDDSPVGPVVGPLAAVLIVLGTVAIAQAQTGDPCSVFCMRPATWNSEPGYEAQTRRGSEMSIWVAPSIVLGPDSVRSAEYATQQFGEPGIEITLSKDGARALEAYTADHVGESIAVYLGAELVSVAVIEAPIVNGRVSIAGDLTEDEARRFASMLGESSSGILPMVVAVNLGAVLILTVVLVLRLRRSKTGPGARMGSSLLGARTGSSFWRCPHCRGRVQKPADSVAGYAASVGAEVSGNATCPLCGKGTPIRDVWSGRYDLPG